jgi:hypothetical protein
LATGSDRASAKDWGSARAMAWASGWEWEGAETKNSPTPEAGSGTEVGPSVVWQVGKLVDWQAGVPTLRPDSPTYPPADSQPGIYPAVLRFVRSPLGRDALCALHQFAQSLRFYRKATGTPHVIESLAI